MSDPRDTLVEGLPAVTGEWVLPGDPAFEEAVFGRVFNGRRPERRPRAVLVAADVDDVVTGVRAARSRGWQVAVRAGGHSWAVWSVRDDSLLIDLGALRSLSYDDRTEVVVVGPAATGGDDLAPFLAERGRFFAGGHCPSVGLGGFLLQGGQGWCARRWGWASEQVVAVDVVTADGDLVRADAGQNTDLYWAARGAGPGFPGIAVAFHLRTRPSPGAVVAGVELYPMELFDQVMTWLQQVHATLPAEIELVAVSQTLPMPIPGHDGSRVLIVTGTVLADDRASGEALLDPLWTCPVADRALLRLVDAHPDLRPLYRNQELANPRGHRYRVDNAWLDGPPRQVVPALRTLFTEMPTDRSFAIWYSMAPLRDLPDMAFSLQTDVYCAAYVVYEDEAQDAAHREWLHRAMTELQPVTAGQYLGDSDLDRRQLRVFSDESFARLRHIRADRDPDRLFAGYLAGGGDATNRNHWEVAP